MWCSCRVGNRESGIGNRRAASYFLASTPDTAAAAPGRAGPRRAAPRFRFPIPDSRFPPRRGARA